MLTLQKSSILLGALAARGRRLMFGAPLPGCTRPVSCMYDEIALAIDEKRSRTSCIVRKARSIVNVAAVRSSAVGMNAASVGCQCRAAGYGIASSMREFVDACSDPRCPAAEGS